MKSFIYFTILLIFSPICFAQTNTIDIKRDNDFLENTNSWFNAWKLVCKDIYKIKKLAPVEFVFFDDKYVYSTSKITIKKGVPIKGKDLMNLKFNWKKELHHGIIKLPDNSEVPIGLMSFSSEIPNQNDKSFFVMPLTSFWKQEGVESEELGLENLITGVFIHEFTHSQQFLNFGKRVTELEQKNNFNIEFSDNIVQNLFIKDSLYLKYYKKENEVFYASIKSKNLDKQNFNEGLDIMKKRQKTFFKNQYQNLKEIDDIFLTMEGLGQYSMYLWLTHPKGGNIEKDLAIKGVRRGGKWWSQDEGFALFLILDKLTQPKNWASQMFNDKTESIIKILDRYYSK